MCIPAPLDILNSETSDKTFRYLPLEPFTHYEHGKDANAKLSDLLRGATSVNDLTPNTGAEVRGVQLSSLGREGKDQLALFVAQKKVVGECTFTISS